MDALDPNTVVLKQVRVARRRLLVEQFFRRLPWCLTASLAIAVVAILVPKIFVFRYSGFVWTTSFICGAMIAGFGAALLWTVWCAKSELDAAVELDRRFELKERVSTMLALTPAERESEAGRALVSDAVRRASSLDVKSEFGVILGRRSWLPLLPAALVLLLTFFLPDKEQAPPKAAENEVAAAKEQIERSTEDLRRKLAERRKEAQAKGLEEAAGLFEKLEQATEEMKKQPEFNREQALVKLNDLAKQLEERRQSLGGGEQVQKQLNELKNMQKGPADQVADAIRDGNLKQAQQELDKLAKQLKDGQLDKAAQQKLADQMQQMQQKLQQAADAQQEAMKDVQQQMEQAQQQGDQARAQQLQQQLNQLAQQGQKMDQMNQMAQQLGQAAKQLQNGDPQQASQALDQMAQQLSKLQKENDELESLDEALNQIADAKQSMNCKKCGGKGCEHCQGQGQGQQPGQDGGEGQQVGNQPGQNGKQGQSQGPRNQQKVQNGKGIGVGSGPGDGAETELKGNFFDTKVKQQLGPGTGVIVDRVDGPNIRGRVQQEVKEGLSAARREESDPLTGARLPKTQRDHAREYFDAFRGEKPAQP